MTSSVQMVDKSGWEQARYGRRARDRLHSLRESGRLAVCVVRMAELLYSARDVAELSRLRLELGSFPYLHCSERAERQIEEVMSVLATRGQHHLPIPDLMLAAIAQAASATVLHYDSGYERIAAVTGQPHEWVVPRGSGHGGDGAE
ncbi:MAG: PIN domain-containing protein [Actinomycetota bacterium]